MRVADEARAVQDRAISRTDRAANAALVAWRRVDAADLDGSWEAVAPRVDEVVAAAVVANAAAAARFTGRVAAADGMAGDVLIPEAFAGVDGSGRDMRSLLHGAVTTTKQAIGAGLSLAEALVAGGSYLSLMVKTAVADVERSASAAAATGKGYVRYVRLINPGACSRCAVLAGSDRFRSHFERHPGCRCSTVPVAGGTPDGLFDSPSAYFESLSEAEQDRVFTQAGAEAIRLGADPTAVVNARRGASRSSMKPGAVYSPSRLQRSVIGQEKDGTPILGYVTVEGKTKRGTYGRAQRDLGASRARPRLMPESIISLTDDVQMRQVLLRDAGYTRPVIRDTGSNAWIREQGAQRATDRRIANDFYRSKGIQTG